MSAAPRPTLDTPKDKPPGRTPESQPPMQPFPISTASYNTNNVNNEWPTWEGGASSQPYQTNTWDSRGVVGMVHPTLQERDGNTIPSPSQDHRAQALSSPVAMQPFSPVHPMSIPQHPHFLARPLTKFNGQGPTFPVPIMIPAGAGRLHHPGNYTHNQPPTEDYPRGMPVEDDSAPYQSHPRGALVVNTSTGQVPIPGHGPYSTFPPPTEFSSYYLPRPESHFSTYPHPPNRPPFAIPHLSMTTASFPPTMPGHPTLPSPHLNDLRYRPVYSVNPGPPAPPLFYYGSPAPGIMLSPPMQAPPVGQIGGGPNSAPFRLPQPSPPRRSGNIPILSRGPPTPTKLGGRLTHTRGGSTDRTRRTHDGQGASQSPLLAEFRQTVDHTNKAVWTLQDLRGHISEFSGDQHGSRFIQSELSTASEHDKQWVFEEIIPVHFDRLMQDVFGNYVIQKLFEFGNDHQRFILGSALEQKVVDYSLHLYACRVVQAALNYITPTQQSAIVSRLHDHILLCIRDAQGNHVVQKLIETVDARRLSFLQTICDHIQELSSHAYGCRVLQRCLAYLAPEHTSAILAAIHRHTLDFVQDQFGNYVIQYIITNGREVDKDRVISKISDNLIKLAQQKFASNVCEKALEHASAEARRRLIDQLLAAHINGQPATSMMLKHQYANYVLQTAIRLAEEDQLQALLDRVQPAISEFRKTTSSHNKPIDNVEKIILARSESPVIALKADNS